MALDPAYFFYSDGTITLTNGSDIATGNFTAWDPAVLPFDFVFPNDGTDGMSVIQEVLAMDQIRLAKPWGGPDLTDVPYFIVRWTKHTDPKIYAIRLSEYLARLKAIPENIEEIAQQITDDADAVAGALAAITQAAADVAADRQAVDAAAGTIEADRATAVTARNEAVAARDVAVSAAGSTQALWDTRAAAQAATLPTEVQYLRTAGYATVGDGGGALYKRLAAAPSPAMAWHFQTADGAWWQLVPGERGVNVLALGAKATGAVAEAAANTAAIQAAIDYAAALKGIAYIPAQPLSYVIGSKLIARSTEMLIEGDGEQSRIQGTLGWSGEYFEIGTVGTSPASGTAGCSVTGIHLIAPLGGSATGIRAKNANGRQFHNCWFSDLSIGINATQCYALRLVECVFLRLSGWAVYSDTPAHNLVMDACRAYTVGGTTGGVLRIDGVTANIVMKHGDYEHCSRIAFLASPSAFTYVDNYSERCYNSEFEFSGTAKGFVCDRNTFALLLEPDLTSAPAFTSTINNVSGGSFAFNNIYYQNFAFGANCFDFDVGPNDITNGTIGASPFRVPTLTNTYTQSDGSLYPVGYRKDKTGTVELRGKISGGASSSGTPAFTLPAGYRPAKHVTVPVVLGTGLLTYAVVYNNGQVVPASVGSGASVYIDGITFKAGA